ncbi:MAG: phage holin family protein [Chloroflexota bacterium]
MLQERILKFNWRLSVVRILVNALSLGLTVLILPGLSINGEHVLLTLLMAGIIFGILNALIRPILQFILFNFLFATFGLVLVIINFILLFLLGQLTTGWFNVEGWTWLVLAAIMVGLFGVIFENLLGMTPPIVDKPNAYQPPSVSHTLSRVFAPEEDEADEATESGEQA